MLDCLEKTLLGSFAPVEPPLQIKMIGFHVLGVGSGQKSFFFRCQLQAQLLCDLLRDVFLHRKNVAGLAPVLRRAQRGSTAVKAPPRLAAAPPQSPPPPRPAPGPTAGVPRPCAGIPRFAP